MTILSKEAYNPHIFRTFRLSWSLSIQTALCSVIIPSKEAYNPYRFRTFRLSRTI